MGLSTTYTKTETDYLLQKLESELASGLKGKLAITDTAPNAQGLYILSDVGTYTNLGGLVATADKLNYAYFDGTTWSLIATDLPQPIVNNYTNNNTYNLDPEQIVPSEALYTDDTLAGDIIKRVDINTGENVNYRETTTWYDETVMDDNKVDGVVYIKKNGKYYALTDFLNGVITKDFDLKGGIFNAGDKLEFRGGSFSNGTIQGNNTTIIADAVKIFGLDLVLSGRFNSSAVYVEWYGSIANDYNSVDLRDSIDRLNTVFWDILMNEGTYFSNKCNIQVNGLTGKGINTNVDFRCKSNDRGFILGVDGGGIDDRTYRNYIRNLKCSFDSTSKAEGVYGILVGATHKPLVENVQVSMNATNLTLNESELLSIHSNISTDYAKLNAGICFNGAGEVIWVNNFMTISTVGIMFLRNYDFVQFYDYMSWNGENGFSTVFIKYDSGSNILFSGSQSWCQGLYGLYAMPCDYIAGSFVNYKVENARIEQLSHVKVNNKLVGCNFYIGEQYYLHSLILNNIMFSGETNGIDLNHIRAGKVEMSNIGSFDNPAIPKDFSVKVDFASGFGSNVIMKNVSIAGEIVATNYDVMGDEVVKKLIPTFSTRYNYENKHFEKFNQNRVIAHDITDYIHIEDTALTSWASNCIAKKIKLEVVGNGVFESCEFIYFRDKSTKIIQQLTEGKIVIGETIQENLFTVIKDSSGVLFLFNRLGVEVVVNIENSNIIL